MATDRYHHGNLRQALIDEAGTVLERYGVEAITFRGLARALDVSHAAPGHHFSDRTELLAELAANGYAGLADAMAEAQETSEPEDWLRRSGQAYVRFGVSNPERYRMMFASRLVSEDGPQNLLDESARAYLLLLRACYQQEPDGDPSGYTVEEAELSAWSMVHGAVMLWLDGQLGPSLTEERFVELTDEMLARTTA